MILLSVTKSKNSSHPIGQKKLYFVSNKYNGEEIEFYISIDWSVMDRIGGEILFYVFSTPV